MTTNIEIEARIRQRAVSYPTAAQADIETLLAETKRLRDALGEEYELRVKAEDLSARQLVEATRAKATIRDREDTIRAQSKELAEQDAQIRALQRQAVKAA